MWSASPSQIYTLPPQPTSCPDPLTNLAGCCCSAAQSCLTLCHPVDYSIAAFLVLQYLLEFSQTHVHWIDDAIQPSHLLLPTSPALTLSQNSGSFPMSWLFTTSGQSIGALASVLPMNIQSWFTLGLTGLTSLPSKGLSRVFSSTTNWKHQFFGAQPCYVFLEYLIVV